MKTLFSVRHENRRRRRRRRVPYKRSKSGTKQLHDHRLNQTHWGRCRWSSSSSSSGGTKSLRNNKVKINLIKVGYKFFSSSSSSPPPCRVIRTGKRMDSRKRGERASEWCIYGVQYNILGSGPQCVLYFTRSSCDVLLFFFFFSIYLRILAKGWYWRSLYNGIANQ